MRIAAFGACVLSMHGASAAAAGSANVRLVVPATVEESQAIRFKAKVSQPAKRVALYVDGKRRWIDRSRKRRFTRVGSLSTTGMAAGRHKLRVSAALRNGRVASTSRTFYVAKGGGWGRTKPPKNSPAPEPAPAPTESAQTLPSDLLFEGMRIGDFALNQSAPGAITEVADPTGSGAAALQMTVDEGDVYPITPTENPRAQLLSPSIIDPGEEYWWSAKFYLPADFPSSVPGWLTVLQGPYGPPFNGTPPFHLEVNGSELRWQRNSTYGWDIPWRMPVMRGRWVEVLLHQRFASDGWVEMWVNGQQVTFFEPGTYNPSKASPTQHLQMKTMDASNNGGSNFTVITNYRKAGMFDTVSLLHGPMRIGTTSAAAQG